VKKTSLAPQDHAYPLGGQTREGNAYYPDDKIRRVWAGIPDTYFSIPAHGRYRGHYLAGRLLIRDEDGELEFILHPRCWWQFATLRTKKGNS
jgi:hypothetical protein